MSYSWINRIRVLNSDIIDIDENYEIINTVPGLKTLLYEHQKPIIKAMLDLEQIRKVECIQYETSKHIYEINANAGVLSEAVGSGKTIDILSIILLNKISNIECISQIDLLDKENKGRGNLYPTSIIKKTFHNVLSPTIIFVGVSVIKQWSVAIKTFTNLKFICITNVRELQCLINMMCDNSINKYDIVLVKNGKVTRPIILPSDIILEKRNITASAYIYNLIANMRNICWSRVVVDDFDTINLPRNASIVNGLFTWYISSTRKCMSRTIHSPFYFKNTADLLMYDSYGCSDIMSNDILFNSLNIRNNPDFIKGISKISMPIYYIYKCDNPNLVYLNLLNGMTNTEVAEIVEMINGDAINTAAEKLGIKTHSVADIFQNILGKQFDNYKKATTMLEYLSKIESNENRLQMCDNPVTDDTYTKKDLLKYREILYNYPNLKTMLESTKLEYTELKNTSGVAIARVKSNIKGDECPICTESFSDEENVIVKCCGVILCCMCCFSVVFKNNNYSNAVCSNCRNKITIKDLIYLSEDFDLTKISTEDIDYKIKSSEIKQIKQNPGRTKFEVVINIINNVDITDRKCVDLHFDNILTGNYTHPKCSYNKVLIFTNYDETIESLVDNIKSNNIKYWRLCGTYSKIAKTAELFNNCAETCALIINSTKHCSGLNLQTATDLIFMNKYMDKNVETQAIGRAHRLGRIHKLSIHFILYENEINLLTV